ASDGVVTALAEAPWLAGLTSFIARGFGSKGVLALARSKHAPRLARLNLSYVTPGKEGMQALIASPLVERVAELTLSDADVGGRVDAGPFAPRDWPRLTALSLPRNKLHETGVRKLAEVKGFSALKRLNLEHVLMSSAGLRVLLAS